MTNPGLTLLTCCGIMEVMEFGATAVPIIASSSLELHSLNSERRKKRWWRPCSGRLASMLLMLDTSSSSESSSESSWLSYSSYSPSLPASWRLVNSRDCCNTITFCIFIGWKIRYRIILASTLSSYYSIWVNGNKGYNADTIQSLHTCIICKKIIINTYMYLYKCIYYYTILYIIYLYSMSIVSRYSILDWFSSSYHFNYASLHTRMLQQFHDLIYKFSNELPKMR